MPLRFLPGLFMTIALAILPVFAHLDSAPIQLWDEGRLAVSALEMSESVNPVIVTYNHQPEMWSTKPPLLIWIQALSLKVIGVNVLAIRLPVAIAALFTCIFMYVLFSKKYKAPWLGIVSVLILVTTTGYVHLHAIRSGDYDGMLTFFTTMYVWLFFIFLEEQNKKYFWAAVVFVILATLSKGIQGLIFILPVSIWAVYRRRIIGLIKAPYFYVATLVFLFIIAGYYGLREYFNPGYLQAVMQNEVTGRYNTELEGHGGNVLYYVTFLLKQGFESWWIWALLGSVSGLVLKERLLRNIAVFNTVVMVSYLIIISNGSTKLDWYLVPVYPFLAISAAIAIYGIFTLLSRLTFWESYINYNLLPYFFLFVIFVNPYSNMFFYIASDHRDGSARYDATVFLHKILKGDYLYEGKMKVTFDEYHSSISWYVDALKKHDKYVDRSEVKGLHVNELVLAYQDGIKQEIEANFETIIVDNIGGATLYMINGKK